MKTSDFEKEIQKIDPRLTIVPNPNRPGLSNILLDGRDVCPVPAEEIKDEPDTSYTYMFPNGMMGRHNSRADAINKIQKVLDYIKTDEGREVFFG
jgi:hypothetical protein